MLKIAKIKFVIRSIYISILHHLKGTATCQKYMTACDLQQAFSIVKT